MNLLQFVRSSSTVLASLTLGLGCLQTQAQTVVPLTQAQLLAQMTPDMAQVVEFYDLIRGTPLIYLPAPDARQQLAIQDANKILLRASGAMSQPTILGSVRDGITIPGSDGNQIPIRIYTPAGAGPFPVVVYFHGGGFVVGTIDTYDESARALANMTPAIVVSVEYRKGPEAPFPAAYNDAIASYKWVTANIGKYNGLAGKVALAGESAGGNLATEVAIAARDQGLQAPTAQILIYPIATARTNDTSDQLYVDQSLPLYTAELSYFSQDYLYYSVAGPNDPRVSPINANLQGLAPATILSAQLDPLESDGITYYNALLAANNKATYRLFNGVTHEFFGLGLSVQVAQQAEQFAASQLAASFQ